MNLNSTVDENSCRICLRAEQDKELSDEDTTNYFRCTGFKIKPQDVPKKICEECSVILHNFRKFQDDSALVENELSGRTLPMKTETFEMDTSEEDSVGDNDDLDKTQVKEKSKTNSIEMETQAPATIAKTSREAYNRTYKRFVRWAEEKGALSALTEDILLEYFREMSKKYKSSTLWARYSMIKQMLFINNITDISHYDRLVAFIKDCSEGYKPKTTRILTREHVDEFIERAPDEKYLFFKVVAMFGLFGGCLREDLWNLTLDDVTELDDALDVGVQGKSFIIEGEDYLNLYKKYLALRPPDTKHRRLLVQYHYGKCRKVSAGINCLAKIPSEIAAFLELENPKEYTARCFRNSSANMLNNTSSRQRKRKKMKVAERSEQNRRQEQKPTTTTVWLPQTSNYQRYDSD